MKIIDISVVINNDTIVYPNNPPVVIESVPKTASNSSGLSKISFGSHTATHIDAPSHTIEFGDPIEYYSLENFIGECQVFDFSYLNPGELIKISDFEKALNSENSSKKEISAGDRILVKTSNSDRGYEEFYEDFVALSGDCADWLAEKNIYLFGIDYLSIKKRGSADNRAHNSLLSKNIPIIEGLNLKDVTGGTYEIFCPPLKLTGVDGAPTRAILIIRE
jgi:arylformamidase